MKITLDFLKEQNACSDDVEFVTEKKLIGLEADKFLKQLIKLDKLDYSNWLIVRVMTRPQYIAYAIYAAEQVIDIYEKQYPNDNRPRLAIEAAKAVLKLDSEETRAAAWAAAWAAGAARDAAWDAAWAAGAARDAAPAARKEMQERILNYGIGLLADKVGRGSK